MPHMLSSGKKTIPDRSMIFELWGNIGLRKGDYKLWADVGRDHSPDWPALAAKLKDTNLSLFDLSKDVAETTDLRMQRPEVYASLKADLVDHIAGINADYPGGGISKGLQKEKVKPEGNLNPAPKHRSQEQFFNNRDRNGDGELPWRNTSATQRGEMFLLTKRFKKIDSNGDSKLRLDELKK